VKVVEWHSAIFIVGDVILSYYVYVIQLCSLTVANNVERMLYLIGYHILFVVFMWASWQRAFTEIGRIPVKFKIPRALIKFVCGY
jgi:palmitoyltransferase